LVTPRDGYADRLALPCRLTGSGNGIGPAKATLLLVITGDVRDPSKITGQE
jgi:hypothetical protein